jgi:hypothetical protein
MSRPLPPRTPGSPLRWAALAFIGALYVAACATPCVEFAGEPPARDVGDLRFFPDVQAGPQLGITALALGWSPPWTIPWTANAVLLVGAILLALKRNGAALYCGIAAALLGFGTWALFPFDDKLIRLLVGYYLWQASLLALAVAAALLLLRARGSPNVVRVLQ